MKEVQECGNQSQSRDQKATFNIEAQEAEVSIGELASQCTAQLLRGLTLDGELRHLVATRREAQLHLQYLERYLLGGKE